MANNPSKPNSNQTLDQCALDLWADVEADFDGRGLCDEGIKEFARRVVAASLGEPMAWCVVYKDPRFGLIPSNPTMYKPEAEAIAAGSNGQVTIANLYIRRADTPPNPATAHTIHYGSEADPHHCKECGCYLQDLTITANSRRPAINQDKHGSWIDTPTERGETPTPRTEDTPMQTPKTDEEAMREYAIRVVELERELAAANAEIERLRDDADRLNWLSGQHVDVRIPLRYGSRPCIIGSPDLEEETWDLRAAIDAARKGGEG